MKLRAALLTAAALLAAVGAGCSAGSETSCEKKMPDLTKVPPLPDGVTVVAEETSEAEFCGHSGAVSRLLTAESGDSADLVRRVLGMVAGREWKLNHEYRPVTIATSDRRKLILKVVSGPDQKALFAQSTTTVPAHLVDEAKRRAVAGEPPLYPPASYNWLGMDKETSDRLDALLASKSPAVVLMIVACTTDC